MGKVVAVAVMACLLSASALQAQEAPPPKSLSNTSELSYVNTSGNSKTQALRLSNQLVYKFEPEPLKLTWNIGALYAKSDGAVSAERYNSDVRGDYDVIKDGYLYGDISWLNDRFAGLDARWVFGAGGGYRVYNKAPHLVEVEGGPQYVVEDRAEGQKDTNYAAGRAAVKYAWQITDKSKFTQLLEDVVNLENLRDNELRSVSALQVAVSANIAWKTSLEIRYDGLPAKGFHRTDRVFSTALVVTY